MSDRMYVNCGCACYVRLWEKFVELHARAEGP